MRRMLLPDINVWLALVFNSHLHHPSAITWLNSITDETAFFCRVTQQGFLRLSNNPKVFPTDAVSTIAAWQLYDTSLNDSRVAFAEEPAGLEAAWRRLTQGRTFTTKLWNDAYLAAFAEAGGYAVITFDNGFRQYKSADCTVLS